MKILLSIIFTSFFIFSCQKEKADLIIISSMYATDIFFQLVELGFASNRIKIFDNY